jgi:hypothetical protein
MRDARERGINLFYLIIRFNASLVSFGYMLKEFCEEIHCDQYTPSLGGAFAKCLLMQKELSRVCYCPLGNDKIIFPGAKK